MTGYFPEELTNLNVTSHSEKLQQRVSERGKEKQHGLKPEMGSKSTEPYHDDSFHICLQFWF